MSFRVRLVLIGLGLILVWGGGQGVLTAATNRAPVAVSCADYVPSQMKGKWLELRDCEVPLLEGAHIYKGADSLAATDEVYIPLHVPGHGEGDRSRVYLASRDPELLAIYNGFGGITGEAQAKAYLERHRARLAEVRTVRGLVRYGIELTENQHDLLAGTGDVTDDFVVIDEEMEPEMGASVFMLVGGLVMAVAGVAIRMAPERETIDDLLR